MSALTAEIKQAVQEVLREHLADILLRKKRLLTIPEASVYLTLAPRTISDMLSKGELPAVGKGNRRMLDVEDLDQWIERHKG